MSTKENETYYENLMELPIWESFAIVSTKKTITEDLIEVAERLRKNRISGYPAGWLARHDPEEFQKLSGFEPDENDAYWDWYEQEERRAVEQLAERNDETSL